MACARLRNASTSREKEVAAIANFLSAAGVIAVLVGDVEVGVRVGVVLHGHRDCEVDARPIPVIDRHCTRLLLLGEIVWVRGVLFAIARRGRGESDRAVGELFHPELGRDGVFVLRLVRRLPHAIDKLPRLVRRLPGLYVTGDQPLTIICSLICARAQGVGG